MEPRTSLRTLERALEVAGGDRIDLAKRLGIRPALLARLLRGSLPIPTAIFLRTTDLLIEIEETKDAPKQLMQPLQKI